MSTSQPARSKLALDDLFALWDGRSESYGNVCYGSAIAKQSGIWKHLITYFFPLHRTERRGTNVNADYGDFKIAGGTISLKETKEILRGIIDGNTLRVPGLTEIPFSTNLHPESWKRFFNSADRRFPIFFPFLECRITPTDQQRATAPQNILWASHLPVFPTGEAAIEHFLFTKGGFGAYGGDLFALVPDYRARIRELKLSTRGVEATIDCLLGWSEENLIAKVYYETADGGVRHGEPRVENGKAAFPGADFPHRLVFALLSRSNGDLIDEKTFYGSRLYDGIVVETSEQDIENLLLAGESDTLEFKRELPQGEKLAKEAVAFANRRGGQILIGVDDDAEVVGCQLQNVADTVDNILRSYCDPPLTTQVTTTAVRQKRVIVLKIAEGKDKPYTVREKGVYIRSSGTSRIATRYELDQMLKDRNRAYS